MDEKKLLIGYDLNDTAVQISVFRQGKAEPDTLRTAAGGHKYQIPAVLCRTFDGRWLFGTEAKKAATLREGVAVGGLAALALEGKSADMGGESFDGVSLLARFLGETIRFAARQAGNDTVGAVVFTVPEFSLELAKMLKDAAPAFGAEPGKVFVQDYSESFYYYVASQPKEIWLHQVMLFWYERDEIRSFELEHGDERGQKSIRIREGPACGIEREEEVVLLIKEEEYRELKDKSFLNFLRKCFGKKLVSAVFLVGDGFDGDWMKDSLNFICGKRRAFQGKNLFTKGAAYAAKYKAENRNPGGYRYLSGERVQMSVGLRVRSGGDEKELLLMNGSENWYEAEASLEVIAGAEKELSVFLIRTDNGERREERIPLDGLPDRPQKTLRLGLSFVYESRDVCRLLIKDAGFGPAFPATEYEKEVLLRWEA